MAYIHKVTFFLFSIFAFVFTLQYPIVEADDTVLIDLSEHSESDNFYVDLDGDWMFFEGEFLTPEESAHRVKNGEGMRVSIPSSFTSQVGKNNTYGTYSTKVKISEVFAGKALAIHIPYECSAYVLYSDDVEVSRNGEVGTNLESHVSEMSPKSGYFKKVDNEFMLTMHMSNFNYADGGFQNSIYIGDSSSVTQKVSKKMALQLFLNGCIFIIGLFMFFFGLYRRKERLFFVFGIFSMLIAIRALFAVPYYYTLLFPEISWAVGTKLEYLLTEAATMTFLMLICMWYKEIFSKKLIYGLLSILTVLMAITLFTQPDTFQPLFLKVFYLSIPFFFYVIYVALKSFRTQSSYAKVNLIGLAIVFVAFFNDFALAHSWYDSVRLMLPAVGVYVLMHFILMSKGFAESIKETEKLNARLSTLNKTLDRRVQERTKQLNKLNEELQQLALTDGLTGIYNRHSLNEFLYKSFNKAKATGIPLSILMLDLDYFKKYNDHFGHVKGDQLLQKLVEIVTKQLPENSFFARYGGEEFVIVLSNTEYGEAFEIAELVRATVEKAGINHPMSDLGIVTYSIGVATMTHDVTFDNEVRLIAAADQKLYEAKQSGRNHVK